MSDHFSPIGFKIGSGAQLQQLVKELYDGFVEEFHDDSQRHFRWTDSSGASLAIHIEGDGITCLTPFFAPANGLTRWRVTTRAPREDADCAHCGGADCDVLDASGEMITRASVQWLHFAPYHKWLQAERTYDLEVVAFTDRIQFFPDEASFTAANASERPGLAACAFIPTGMFKDSGDLRRATSTLFAGRVLLAEQCQNSRGGPFWRVRVETLPGAIDVVAAAGAMAELPPIDSLALTEAWLVGRPLEAPGT